MNVYKAINAVQADLSKAGISKDRKNDQQGYKFRGIDDVYNALAPLLAQHGLCVLPRCTERQCVERTNAKGTALFYVTVRAEFDFVCAEDGSKHTVSTYGEAMDSGDKATNKAMSAAYKYACMQAFSIPTEGDNDADASTHEVTPSVISATRTAFDSLPKDWQDYVIALAAAVENAFEQQGPTAAVDVLDAASKRDQLDPTHIAAMWSKVNSRARSAIKAVSERRNQKAAA